MPRETTKQASNSIDELLSDDHQVSWKTASDLSASLRYAIHGLVYGFVSQRNFRIHVLITFLVFSLSFWLHLSTVSLAILVLMATVVLALELLNTAIEAAVDLTIGHHFHSLARIAKDCAAAAVLVAASGSIAIALLILLPPLLIRVGP